MSVAFVTAIGTDCGKTHATAAIVRMMREQGKPVLALKPLMSGFDPNNLPASDAGRLLTAMGWDISPDWVDQICWRRFPEWAAPNIAARKAGITLTYSEMFEFLTSEIQMFGGPVLIEGAGGVMSPLTDTHTNLDLIGDLKLPVVLLASNYLGAVSHTLTALDVLDRRGANIAAVVVTQPLPTAGSPAPLVDELARWTGHRLVEAAYSAAAEDDRRWAGPLTELVFG